MSDIFEEVEESLAKDDWTQRWEKYGIFVYIAAGLLVGAVAFLEFRGDQTQKQTNDQIVLFEAAQEAQESGDYQSAIGDFEALIAMESKLSTLVGHRLAGATLSGTGDSAGAIEALERIASPDGSPFEQLALLKAAYLKVDKMTFAQTEAMLGSLPSQETQMGSLALELLAAKAFEAGDYQRARDDYGYLAISPFSAPNLTNRAQRAMNAIPETGGTPIETPENSTPETAEGPDQ
ncbi:MAG: hypothetical protein AAFX02_06380 [Pseudomonadota bacterium]